MLSPQEKKHLYDLVKSELKSFKTEKKSLIIGISPELLAGEEKYEAFLEQLKKKLKQ